VSDLLPKDDCSPFCGNSSLVATFDCFQDWRGTTYPGTQKLERLCFELPLPETDTGGGCTSRTRILLAVKSHSPIVDAGLTSMGSSGLNSTIIEGIEGVNLIRSELSMQAQLRYKAIIMLEGNDVASGLKWALLSNSVVIMRKPNVTSWAMEELLEPWVHYIPLDVDLLDIVEKVQWVLDHDEEARKIAVRGTLWMKDMVAHPDADNDADEINREILKRYKSHFQAADDLV
jgi:hypothetical protein